MLRSGDNPQTRPRHVGVRALAALFAMVLMSCGAAQTSPVGSASPSGALETVDWQPWSAETFARARAEGRPIMLSVQAVWCHWCHVMNETTYHDSVVLERLGDFVAIRADSDARPDLAERFRRYGWPATVFLTPDGEQILGLRGYRNPRAFSSILERVSEAFAAGRTLEDPAPTPDGSTDLRELRVALTAQLDAMYDEQGGGWGRRQRYPLSAPVEHALFRASVHQRPDWLARALFTLEQYSRLIDPVFGGMYQYSVPLVWDRPHHEKIVEVQAGAIRAFARAHRSTGDEVWLSRAANIERYVAEFLTSPDAEFFVSQDADLGTGMEADAHLSGAEYYALDELARRARGYPRVDQHIYADANGRLIGAFAELASTSGDARTLGRALRAVDRIHSTHLRDGLFVHDAASSAAGPAVFYLSDQVHMLDAFIALHQATGDARHLGRARELADGIVSRFSSAGAPGFTTLWRPGGAQRGELFGDVRVPILNNAVLAQSLLRLARLELDHDAGDRWRTLAVSALEGCNQPGELRRMGRMVGELLVALEMLEAGHVILSVVGPQADATTDALFRTALSVAEPTRLVERAAPGDSRYPYPGQPAVYLCSDTACSLPVTEPARLAGAVAAFVDRH